MDRRYIKEKAKSMFRLRYWPFVGAAAVAGMLVAGASSVFSITSNFSSGRYKELAEYIPKDVLRGLMIALIVVGTLGLLYTIFVGNVVGVGSAKLFLAGYRGERWTFADLFSGFRTGYWRNVGAMALMSLFITLGTLCFIIPGIIVAYGLAQVPYLLAEDPSLTPMKAIRRSWDLMLGKKFDLFVFGLSFLGWALLSALTLGVVGIFYVDPYVNIATAGYYDELTGPAREEEYTGEFDRL